MSTLVFIRMYEIIYFSFALLCATLPANANENDSQLTGSARSERPNANDNDSHSTAPIFGRFPSYGLLLHLRVGLSRTE